MGFLGNDDTSIDVTTIFTKIVGFWVAADRFEHRIRTIALIYTLFAILFGVWVQIRDLYFSWSDFSACLFTAANTLSVAMSFVKILILLGHKDDFFHLILYIRTKFLRADYDDYERQIVLGCKRQCTFFVFFLIFSTNATLVSYAINPLIANIGKNESSRVLPFNMWVNLPLSMTPYYEITFIIQVLSMCHIGVTYFCFDNFFCIMNLHAASQFRILQYRMANMKVSKSIDEEIGKGKIAINSSSLADKRYATFKGNVRQHQALIAYCEKIERVFSLIVLGQVLIFSMIICLDGYQLLMPEVPTRKRVLFTSRLSTSLCQLLMFTFSCDCIIRESANVAKAVYNGPWSLLPLTTSGRLLRKDLVLVIMRSSVPCCLTARGFFVVSLETYTRVLSTAVSYFTLLQQSSQATSV